MPCRPASASAGFTLFELLAVIIILGLVVGMAALSVGAGGRDQQIEEQGNRFIALAGLARQEVMLGGPSLAIGVTQHGYHFLHEVEVEDGVTAWLPLGEHRYLRNRDLLPDDLELELTLEGVDTRLELQPEQPDPHIYVYGTGEVTEFNLVIRDMREPDRKRVVTGDLGGQLELRRELPDD